MYLPLFLDNVNIEIEEYLKKVNDKKITDRYLLMLLFDENTMDINEEFVSNYFVKVNNRLGEHIGLFNFYNLDNIKNIDKLVNSSKEQIRKQDFTTAKSTFIISDFCERMAEVFGINDFPALVIIDLKESIEEGLMCEPFEFPNITADELGEKVLDIINKINDDYNDFDMITQNIDLGGTITKAKIDAYNESRKIDRNRLYHDFYGNNNFRKIFKEKKEFENMTDFSINGLGYSDQKQVSRILKGKDLDNIPKRDFLISVAIFLGKNEIVLNRYIRDILKYEKPFPMDEREIFINMYMKEEKSLTEINELLRKKGFTSLKRNDEEDD